MDEHVNLVATWYTSVDSVVDIAIYLLFRRFPFIACEIFTCEVDIILKTLVEDEEVRHQLCSFLAAHFVFPRNSISELSDHCLFQLMNLLFSFLEPENSHSTLLAGYFSKVHHTELLIN